MRPLLAMLSMLLIADAALAVGVSRFVGVGDIPGPGVSSIAQAISADGIVAVGSSSASVTNPDEAFRWTSDGGIVGLGSGSGLPISGAHDVDADGDVIVGSGNRPNGLAEAFQWKGGKLERIGVLDAGLGFSRATAVSDAGDVIAGYSSRGDVDSMEAVRWLNGGPIASLGIDPPSAALAVSGNGSVIVGFLTEGGVERAMRWTDATQAFALSVPGGSGAPSRATGANRSGEVIVGWTGAPGSATAWRWTAAGAVPLGFLPGAASSQALAVNGAGDVVVGSSGDRAFRWDRDHGMQDVETLLTQAGVDISGWTLLAATGVADDGRTLVGEGINPDGDSEGWVAVVVPLDEDPRPQMRWGAVQSGSGNSHSCGILLSGAVACWGADGDGQSTPPAGVFAQVVTGNQHSCALGFDGDVTCWGNNDFGQAPTTPVAGPFRVIDAGAFHTCGILAGSSRVECWGDDSEGQSGVPAALADQVFLGVGAGEGHTCGRVQDRTVACWGRGENGSGGGQATPRTGPFKSISVGANHSCGIRDNGFVACWGLSGAGQSSPPSGVTFQSLSAGDLHTCGVTGSGTARCWGSDSDGQASPPSGFFASISAGGFHTCGRRPDGTIECWGSDDDGEASPPSFPVPQLGAGADFSCVVQPTGFVDCWGDPTSFTGLPAGSFHRVAAGLSHACGLRTDGTAVCWGTDTNDNTRAPLSAAFTQIAVADAVSCGIRDTAAVQCWGSDAFGSHLPPSGPFVQISGGARHFCAVRENGSVVCWGETTGPTPVIEFDHVASGGRHDCAIRREDGSVVCWGANDEGQLGAPVGAFDALSAGEAHTCGIRRGGALACWGRSVEGQLAAPAGAFVDLAAGFAHACGVRDGGAIACWGLGDEGQTAAPGDDDGDGVASAEDNCPLDANSDQADVDGDGVGDVCDLCPTTPDPLQLDTDVDQNGDPDPDGVGDFCDVCPDVSDPGQELNAAGEGLACAKTRLFYSVNDGGAGAASGFVSRASTGTSSFDVQLDCGSNPRVGEVAIGLVFPEEITQADVNVGGGCEGPSSIGGSFCNNASTDPAVLGATVDRTQSWTAGPGSPPLSSSANPEAVYLRFVGVDNGGTPVLCTSGQRVLLARIEVAGLSSAALAPPFTVQGLEEVLTGLDPLLAVGDDGQPVDETTIELASGSQAPKVTLRVEPHGTDPLKWLVLLDADVNVEVLRFALSGFSGVSTSQMRFVHCTVQSPTDPTRRDCAVNGGPPDPPSEWPSDVDEFFTFTRGPSSLLVNESGRGDTLYIEAVGFAPAGLGFTINPGLATAHVATIFFDPPAGSSLRQPYVTYQGVREVLGGDPVLPTFTTDTVTDADLAAKGSFRLPSDFDGDGFVNEFDKCQFVAEAYQLDSGGAESPVNPAGAFPDGIGNLCQCGDTRGLLQGTNPAVNDGIVVGEDSRGIQEILVGSESDPTVEDRASTEGSLDVNLKDWLTLELNRQGRGAGIGPACVPANPGS